MSTPKKTEECMYVRTSALLYSTHQEKKLISTPQSSCLFIIFLLAGTNKYPNKVRDFSSTNARTLG